MRSEMNELKDCMTYTIEKGIPLAQSTQKKRTLFTETLLMLEVGDSFLAHHTDKGFASYVNTGKFYNKKFAVRIEGDKHRVTRIK